MTHITLSLALPGRAPWRLQFISFCLGLVLTIFFVFFVANANGLSLFILIGRLLLDMCAMAALGFCYFTFVNLNYTSLRIRLLRELFMNGGELRLPAILQKYGADSILDARLERLVRARELRVDGQYYNLGPNSRFILLGSILGWFKRMLGVYPIDRKKWNLGRFADMTVATFVVLGIYWMPLYFYVSGITVSTNLEESVGYRYFYSLRLAFGHEGPWLPQGQLVTLYHVLIQHLLTMFGLPNDQLYPRVDIFCIFANLLPMVLAWLSFIRLSRGFDNKVLSLLIGAIFVFMMQSHNLPGGPGWAMMPDYHVWVIALAVFSASLLPRFDKKTLQEDHKSIKWFLGMGLLMGIAASIKITFILFPLVALAAWILSFWSWRKTTIGLSLATLVCFLTISLVIWASTGFGGGGAFKNYLLQSINFFLTPKGGVVLSGVFYAETLYPLLLSVLILYLSMIRKQLGLTAIGFGGLLYTVFVWVRFYSHSLIEYHAFLLIPCVILVHIYAYTSQPATRSHRWIALTLIPFCSASAIFICTIQQFWPEFITASARSYSSLGSAAMEFHQRLKSGPSPIWILTSDNRYRPNSIESALCKGGMDINNQQWGTSPYVASLFPKFKCAVGYLSSENKKAIPYSTIGFSHWNTESLLSGITRVEKVFDVSLAELVCKDVPGNYGSPFTYCYPRSSVLTKNKNAD